MFADRYFARRYFAGGYFANGGIGMPPLPPPGPTAGQFFAPRHFARTYFPVGYFSPIAITGGSGNIVKFRFRTRRIVMEIL